MAKRRKRVSKKRRQVRKRFLLAFLAAIIASSAYLVLRKKETSVNHYIVLTKEGSVSLFNDLGHQALYRLERGTSLIVEKEVRSFNRDYLGVQYDMDGNISHGYVHASDVLRYHFDESFETSLAAFPDSYRQPIRYLHALYPSWTYSLIKTQLDFNQAALSYTNKALIPASHPELVRSQNVVEGKNWHYASVDTVRYYLDPRLHLNGGQALMFEKLSYNPQEDLRVTKEILSDTNMKGIDESTHKSYAEIFVDVAKKYNISLSNILSRAIQEAGGTSPTLSKGAQGVSVNGKTYYNIFNIGANTGYQDGIAYAIKMNWDNREKAIDGGVAYLASHYTQNKQDSLYLQRFDLYSKHLGTHSYMTNILAPVDEVKHILKGYLKTNTLSIKRHLEIPIFLNMPTQVRYPLRGQHLQNINTNFQKNKPLSTLSLSYKQDVDLEDGMGQPHIQLTDGSYQLEEDIDYHISYMHQHQRGQASFVITGMNGYCGTIRKNYMIH